MTESHPNSAIPDNAQRAAWAQSALDTFVSHTYHRKSFSDLQEADREDAIADLVTDLLHSARLEGFHVESVLARSVRNYLEEIAEETDAGDNEIVMPDSPGNT